MLFPDSLLAVQIDAELFQYLVYGGFAVISAMAAGTRWLMTKFDSLTHWIQPRAEEYFINQNDLMKTAKENLIENTLRVSSIDGKIDLVQEKLSEHSEKLERIDQRTLRLLPGEQSLK